MVNMCVQVHAAELEPPNLQDFENPSGAGITGITVPETDLALDVILKRSQEIGCPLYVAEPLTAEDLMAYKLLLGIAGDRQVYNAALAVHLCQVWLNSRNPGLSQCSWPGRNQTDQTVRKPGVTYYLDGAHTTDSMQGQSISFPCLQYDRRSSVSTLLEYLKGCGFNSAAFCPNILSTTASENIPDQINLTVEQNTMLKTSARNRMTWDDLMSNRLYPRLPVVQPSAFQPIFPAYPQPSNRPLSTETCLSQVLQQLIHETKMTPG
ncbi:hypothetical protein C0Q70_17628 [Pomacea canaliculata]|uniref:Uncharacterized protein n=1 Tax=Pomacea canaliculata TaxID=400727 RepID=A0A2T7NKZ1_POMCA|nr:hypothetical protein C0Q70_17628 [Pomacea canaliculata]